MKKILAIILLVFTITSFSFAADYNYVSIKGLIEQEIGRLIIPQIYEKLDITVDITPLPGKRAQLEAVSGIKDGEIMRIYTYGVNNPSVIRVETPYYYLETMGFILEGSGIVINKKADLAKYKIVKVRGVKHTDNITVGLSSVTDINDTEQMMRFLQSGRAQVALTNTVDGLLILDKLGYDNIVPIERPLAVLDLYHYIHEKHKALVPKVNAVVKEMKDSGELDKIIKEAERKVIDSFK